MKSSILRFSLTILCLISLVYTFMWLYYSNSPGQIIDFNYNPEKHTVTGTVQDALFIKGGPDFFILISLNEISGPVFIARSEDVGYVIKGVTVQMDVPDISNRVINNSVIAERYQMLTPVDAVRTEGGLPIIMNE